MRSFLQWRSGSAILLGEANVTPDETARYFGSKDDGIHLMFNFYVNQFLFYALATSDTEPLIEALEATREHPPAAQWAQFLRNHDELDLGRLTEEQRARVFARFGPEEHMQLYDRGIRRRLAPMLGDPRLIELAYSLQFSLPGTPVLYYGDEIGMGDDLSLPERNALRTPMQWTDEDCAGFSRADTTIRPVVDEGPYSYTRVNVEAQRRKPGSLLSWMRTMIRVRHECPEIGWGSWRILPAGNPRVLAMCYEWQGTYVVVVHNFDAAAHEVRMVPEVPDGDTLHDLLVEGSSHADETGAHRIMLDAYGYRWFRVGTLNYALNRVR
jgi:maltose alpha-D-glucosyltransferase/alpha-amylase